MTDSLLGVDGLTLGGLGIWAAIAMALVGVLGKWVAGMPERRRAANESVAVVAVVEETASDGMYKRMQAEIARLDRKVTSYGMRIDELERELAECRRNHETTNRKLAEAQSEILKLKTVNGRVVPGQRAPLIAAADLLDAATDRKEIRP